MSRAGEGALGGVEMPLRDAHRPSTASTSVAIDIHTLRYRHRYRPMRMARDGCGGKEENSFSGGRCHQRHQGEAASSGNGFLYFVVTLFIINDCIIFRYPADFPAAVTPAAKRNSYRVARRKPHPGLPQGEGTQCQWIRI